MGDRLINIENHNYFLEIQKRTKNFLFKLIEQAELIVTPESNILITQAKILHQQLNYVNNHVVIATPKKFQFGDVVFDTYLKRWAKSGSVKHSPTKFDEQMTGIFLGYRTIFTGSTENVDGFYYFIQEKSHRTALVAYSSNRNPVYVPVENLQQFSDRKKLNLPG